MRPRLMQRLEAAIAASREPLGAACLEAERALYLTRLGRFESAREVFRALRQVQARRASPLLEVWLTLGDGVMEQVTRHGGGARDRMLRAHALATASRLRPMMALTAAWLAFLDYIDDEPVGLARHLAEALQEAAPDQHAARSRACLVAALAYHWGGRLDRAQPWYERTREHAQADGDDLTVAALMANRAAIEANRLRLVSIFEGPVGAAALRQAVLAAESAGHFGRYVGKSATQALLPVAKAQLLVLQGEAAAALALYRAHLAEIDGEGLAHIRPPIDADIAWCLLQLGRQAEAAQAAVAMAPPPKGCEQDACAAAHGCWAQVLEALSLTLLADAQRQLAAAARHAHLQSQARVVELVDAALRQVP